MNDRQILLFGELLEFPSLTRNAYVVSILRRTQIHGCIVIFLRRVVIVFGFLVVLGIALLHLTGGPGISTGRTIPDQPSDDPRLCHAA
jgi:hypothetical protein